MKPEEGIEPPLSTLQADARPLSDSGSLYKALSIKSLNY